jgi:hypothetical protein
VKALVVATKEIGLEVNVDKTKYMVMSRDRNAGRDGSVKIDNSSIDRVEEFKYLETIAIFKLRNKQGHFIILARHSTQTKCHGIDLKRCLDNAF